MNGHLLVGHLLDHPQPQGVPLIEGETLKLRGELGAHGGDPGGLLDRRKVVLMRDGRPQAEPPQRAALRTSATQVTAELTPGDREQPSAHLLPAVGTDPRPADPGLSERLGGEFQRDLGVERPSRQEHEHRLRLISIEGDESLWIGHHI